MSSVEVAPHPRHPSVPKPPGPDDLRCCTAAAGNEIVARDPEDLKEGTWMTHG